MTTSSLEPSAPTVKVDIEFPVSWSRSFLAKPFQRDNMASAIGLDISFMMRTLGVPGVAVVSLSPVRDDELLPNRLIRIFVGGRWCPFPAEVWHAAWSYAAGHAPGLPLGLSEAFDRLCVTAEGGGIGVDPCELLTLVCRAAIYQQPSALLAKETFSAYLHGLKSVYTYIATDDEDSQRGKVQTALRAVLDLGISIGNVANVGAIIAQSEEDGWDDLMLTEGLVDGLRPTCVELHARSDNLRRSTSRTSRDDWASSFRSLRHRLYLQVGINYPHFRFAVDDTLKKNGFALTINHLQTCPRIFADSDDIFTFLEECLRLDAARFICTDGVENILSFTSDMFPDLVHVTRTMYTIEQIAATFRILVGGNLSIYPIRALLQGLLNVSWVVGDPLSVSVGDALVISSEPPDGAWMYKPGFLAAFLRVKVRRYIIARYAGLGQQIRVINLDLDLGQEAFKTFRTAHRHAFRAMDYMRQQQLLDGIHCARKTAESQVLPTCVVTSSEARMSLQQLMRYELPEFPVLAFQELLPDMVDHYRR